MNWLGWSEWVGACFLLHLLLLRGCDDLHGHAKLHGLLLGVLTQHGILHNIVLERDYREEIVSETEATYSVLQINIPNGSSAASASRSGGAVHRSSPVSVLW